MTMSNEIVDEVPSLIAKATFDPASSDATSMPPMDLIPPCVDEEGEKREVAKTVLSGYVEYSEAKEAPRPRDAPTIRMFSTPRRKRPDKNGESDVPVIKFD